MKTNLTNFIGIEVMVPRLFLRSNTNGGERAKQYFTVRRTNEFDPSLIVRKLVLTKDFALYQKHGYKYLKGYKGTYLMETTFGLKIDTLNSVLEVVDEKLREQLINKNKRDEKDK